MNLAAPVLETEWERMWAPYDEPTYAAVLEAITSSDVVLEIGAGDFRLARRMAKKTKKVYAIERNQGLVAGLKAGLPANCRPINVDARRFPFPKDISVAVLLMRHCTSFAQYWSKLATTRCERLITNARWGLGIEIIHLNETRLPFQQISMGWYACRCGDSGFVAGPPERITQQVLDRVWEVASCPACQRRNQVLVLQ